MTRKQKKNLTRILISTAFLLLCNLLPATGVLRAGLFLACYLLIGLDVLRKAFLGIVRGRVFDENFLMTVATLGAIALAIYGKTGDYNEAVAVMLFYQIGEWFQSYAVGKSRRHIGALMDIRPDYANVEENGRLQKVSPETVQPGDIIIVQPGEKVPLDGIVISGTSTLDTSALTGESMPRQAQTGAEIFSGCINLTGVLKIQTTKSFGDSTAAKILDLVENASSRKAKSETFIAKFARIYTPAVCIGALALALIPPLVGWAMGGNLQFSQWIYRALTFLIISCPCALVISIPLSFFAGIGGASREGILVKGSQYLEALSRAKWVVFDKTGTLTQGVFSVSGIHHASVDEEKLLEFAAYAESTSSHPISKSIQKAWGKPVDLSRVDGVQERSGFGVTAKVDGVFVAAGNEKLMQQLGISFEPCHSTGTIVHIAVDGEYAGHIVIADQIKETATEAISSLKKAGTKKNIMLTGDRETVAQSVAQALDLDACYSQLLPADKVQVVENMLAQKPDSQTLVFVGDGINDAPVLARADVGIAMGAMGSDAAIEAADVVLMDDDPCKVALAIRIAKKCMAIVRQNVVFALGVKFLCMALGAVGIAGLPLAIFADVGVMVLAILNAIRCLRIKK